MFRKKKKDDTELAAPAEPPVSATQNKKGRPTRSRKEAEAERARPLVPKDRKLAKQIEKRKRDEMFQREQVALQTGDERYLPIRDKGRVRRFVRDWVDAKWSISEIVLPFMLLFLVAMLAIGFIAPEATSSGVVSLVFIAVLYGLFAISIIEGIITWLRIKRRVQKRYPDDPIPRGTWFYTYSRMLMFRRWRSPRPQVKRGQFPQVSDQTR